MDKRFSNNNKKIQHLPGTKRPGAKWEMREEIL